MSLVLHGPPSPASTFGVAGTFVHFLNAELGVQMVVGQETTKLQKAVGRRCVGAQLVISTTSKKLRFFVDFFNE